MSHFSMLDKLMLWLAAVTLCFNYGAMADGCTITLPTDIPSASPVFLTAPAGTSTYTLFKPTGQVTTLTVGDKLLLVCTGTSTNVIQNVNTNSLELICNTGNIFASAAGVQYTLSTLPCKSIPSSELLLTSQRCADNRGYMYEAGFYFQADQFAPLFSICYDNVTEHTYYTHNTLNGAAINWNIAESTRRAFRASGMKLTTTATNTLYTIDNQVTRFKALFGVDQTYVSTSKFLARGHLSPDADFIFGYEQLATYFYTNVAPEFQAVNAGNWLRVENLARNLAAQFGSDVSTFTSTLGLLQLPTTTNELKPIFLDANSLIEAPMYYYKVLFHSQLPLGSLVMITLNNPYAVATDIVEFCTNACVQYGVNTPEFSDLTRGYTYCCTLADFQSAVVDLPTFDLPAGYP